MLGTMKVEVTGNNRTGTAAKSGRPYCMYQAFVLMPNVQYPQMTEFYAETPQQVPQPGVYDCDITAQIKDGRVAFEIDPRQGRRTNLTSLNLPAPSAVQKVSNVA